MKFEELLNSSLEDVKKKNQEELKKAMVEANTIVDERYNAILSEYTQKITDYIRKNEDRVKGEQAKLEVENKRLISKEKDYWISQVYYKVMEKIPDLVSDTRYKQGLESIIAREAKNGSVIYCSSHDLVTVKTILSSKKINAKVEEDKNIRAGIKIFYPDQSLVRDFTLETILNQMFDDLRDEIAKVLFGE
jgi:V/A-type H+-transporting ATPase subunit E